MKTFIQNRKGQNMSVVVEEKPNAKGLAFVMHGLGGYKEQPLIQTVAQAFEENNFTTVIFDTTNTLGSGESEGNYEDATTTNYYEDLEDIIAWASAQPWYIEPFWLSGHSLGGISTALFAEKYPEKVKGLAPIASVVSGELSFQTPMYKDLMKDWEEKGYKEEERSSRPGVTGRLNWGHVVDRRKYDLLPNANKLTMPVLLVVGDQDHGTPPEHQQMLFDVLPGKKEMHIIKNGPHSFKTPEHLEEIRTIFDNWIKSNL